jgi:hypothetical protein
MEFLMKHSINLMKDNDICPHCGAEDECESYDDETINGTHVVKCVCEKCQEQYDICYAWTTTKAGDC